MNLAKCDVMKRTGIVLALMFLAACGADGTEGEGNDETTDSAENSEVAPDTEVMKCAVENGLPVAEVKVTNSTGSPGTFDVIVQFRDGDTVLGEGEEYTSELAPDQNQTIRMGNMQGDSASVTDCEVTSATLME